MTGKWERSGTVLTPDIPDICLKKRYQDGKHLGRKQVHGQDSKLSLVLKLAPISLCIGEIYLACKERVL